MIRVSLNREAFDIALTRHNLSQKRLAEKLHISRSYLSEIVGDRRKPSAAIRERLLGFFKEYTFDDLFTIERREKDVQNRD